MFQTSKRFTYPPQKKIEEDSESHDATQMKLNRMALLVGRVYSCTGGVSFYFSIPVDRRGHRSISSSTSSCVDLPRRDT